MHLGTAFQLVDDMLDYSGDHAQTGKNLGDDLAEGKATLPLIRAMRNGTPQQSALIRKAIVEGGLERFRRRWCKRSQETGCTRVRAPAGGRLGTASRSRSALAACRILNTRIV